MDNDALAGALADIRHAAAQQSSNSRLGGIFFFEVTTNGIFPTDDVTDQLEILEVLIDAIRDRMTTIVPAPMDDRIQISIKMEGGEAEWAAVPFTNASSTEIARRLISMLQEYDAVVALTAISVSYMTGSALTATGSSTRSESVADQKWYKVDTHSVKNCFWIAFATCLNYQRNSKLITSSADRQRSGKDLKVLFKRKYGEKYDMNVSTEEIYQEAANFREVRINIYNNLYQLVKVYEPSIISKNREVDIMISNNHATALLPRKEIPTSFVLPEKDKVVYRHGYVKKSKQDFNGREEIVELSSRKFACMGEEFPSLIKLQEVMKLRGLEAVLYDDQIFGVIDKEDLKKEKVKTNYKVACMDLETCTLKDTDGKIKTYLIGIAYRARELGTDKIFLNEEPIFLAYEGLDCIEPFFDHLWERKNYFDGYTFYLHNGGKFDLYCILNEYLLYHNQKWKIERFLEVEGCIVMMSIVSVGGTKSTIRFLDSYKLCPISLDGLCKSLGTKTQKLVDSVEHHKITDQNYETFMHKVRPYHRNDCVCLLEAIEKLITSLYEDYKMDFTKYMTAPSVAINIFWKHYYDQKNYPLFKMNKEMDYFVRRGYLGGRTEAYTLGVIGHSWYYDRVSLYPDVGRRLLPYGEGEWVEDMSPYLDENNCLLDVFFGWVELYVESVSRPKSDYEELPFFGVKYSTKESAPKKLIFPLIVNPKTTITVFSEALKYAQRNALSYKYKYVRGLRFRAYPIMEKFFEERFQRRLEKKSKKDLAGSMMEKLAMNSAYGKFALRCTDRDSLKLYSDGYVDYFKTYHDNKLINVSQKGNYTLIRKVHDIETKDTNVAVSAAITEYARMEMHKMVTLIRKKGIWVHYWDTDSLITDQDITKYPDLYKKLVPDGSGKNLGSLKNELIDKLDEFLKDVRWTEREKAERRDKFHRAVESSEMDLSEMEKAKIAYESSLEGHVYTNEEVIQIKEKAKKEGYRFDRGIIIGAKVYLLEYALPKGKKFVMTAFKGFDKRNVDMTFEQLLEMVKGKVYEPFKGTPDKSMLVSEMFQDEDGDWYERDVLEPAGGQLSFQGGKKVLLTETTIDATITIKRVKKKFELNYTKANWVKDPKLTSQRLKPLVLSF